LPGLAALIEGILKRKMKKLVENDGTKVPIFATFNRFQPLSTAFDT
jgi:hypothetical protein